MNILIILIILMKLGSELLYFPKSICASSRVFLHLFTQLLCVRFLVNFEIIVLVIFLVNDHTYNIDYFGETLRCTFLSQYLPLHVFPSKQTAMGHRRSTESPLWEADHCITPLDAEQETFEREVLRILEPLVSLDIDDACRHGGGAGGGVRAYGSILRG